MLPAMVGELFEATPKAHAPAAQKDAPAETGVAAGPKPAPGARPAAALGGGAGPPAPGGGPPWRRRPVLLARDDQGVYFFVDARRSTSGSPEAPPDYRLHVGKKGALARVDLEDVVADDAGFVFVTGGGRVVARKAGQQLAVEWVTASARLGLAWLDPSEYGPLVYGELGVYAAEELGTPCDGRF